MKKTITLTKNITPKNPILIAAWPGMGHVAIKAATFLKDKLQAQLFAKLESQQFFYQTDIVIADSLVQLSSVPQGKFYYWENKFGKQDLVIFISELQPPAEKSALYAEAIFDFVAKYKVKMVFTFAAMLSSIDHTQMPKVWFAVTQNKLISEFQGIEARPMETGQISGLNGLFLGLAKKMKIPGACLLGEIPFYAIQIENPWSSMVVLTALTKFLDINLDVNELSAAGKVMEEEIGKLIEHIKEPMGNEEHDKPITNDDIEKMKNILSSQTHIPNSAKKQIEDLFVEARRDISCAMDLKRTLDEWNAYKDYEDRFLELFRKGEERDN